MRAMKAASAPSNFPRYLTSFVGRVEELRGLKAMLATSRMLTLTGTGGSGKTRLAVELTNASIDRWPDGIWWVDLALVSDQREVSGAVVATMKLPGRGPALDVAAAWLANRRALLVLDNCEHVIAEAADFCATALQRCPHLTIIATSREALRVQGETRWPLVSMRSTDAVQLFEARARLVAPDFKPSTADVEIVTKICERLDGSPLAVELAAARIEMMTVGEIHSQLVDRFRLLTVGNRTAPERHRTLMATIEWSYRLLTDDEAMLFRRLSVFRTGFTLESAQAVCADRVRAVIELLSGLVQKSMVVVEQANASGSRYRLLESQLAYAKDRLQESGELEFVRQRHYEHFLGQLRSKVPEPTARAPGVEEDAWIAREWGNLLAAMEWARINSDDHGLLLAVHLAPSRFTDIAQRRGMLSDSLARSGERSALRVRALLCSANLANVQGDSDAAVNAAEAGVALARELQRVQLLAWALLVAGNVDHVRQDFQAAAEKYAEATTLVKDSSDRVLVTGIKNNVALLAVEKGDYGAGRDILLECLASARAAGDVSETADYLDSIAWAHLGLGDQSAAAACWRESLSLHRKILDDWGTIFCLYGMSRLACEKGDDQRALRLAAAARRLSGVWSWRPDRWLSGQVEETESRSRSRLGPLKSDEAWGQGWAMSLDQVVDYALGNDEPDGLVDAYPLTKREVEIARLVSAGMTNKEIAAKLFIAERTAEGHVERIRGKLGVRSRTEVATWAVEHGLRKREGTP